MKWFDKFKKYLPVTRKQLESMNYLNHYENQILNERIKIINDQLDAIREEIKERISKDNKLNKERGQKQAENTKKLNEKMNQIILMGHEIDRLNGLFKTINKQELNNCIQFGIEQIQQRLVRCVEIQEDIHTRWYQLVGQYQGDKK